MMTLKGTESVNLVMKCKRKLTDMEQYKKVYIEMDRPLAERKRDDNIRTLVNTVNTVAMDKLLIKGRRVVHKDKLRNSS